MTKLLIKAVDRKAPDNVGSYLWESMKPAAERLEIELVRVPTELWYDIPNYTMKGSAHLEVKWVNEQNADGFLFFTNWIGGAEYRNVAKAYKNVQCKTVMWSREDPNHFKNFLHDATYVDVIGTCCSDCIPKYQDAFPKKKVISLPMAVESSLFYGGTPWDEREWDIVFLGNRYRTRQIRTDAERAVILAAVKWARENNKRMGIWGIDKGAFGWNDMPEYADVFQGGRIDRLEAGSIYRNARVALSISSNDYSPTMAPNRVVQILACGTPLIAYKSPATEWQSDGTANISSSEAETRAILHDIIVKKQRLLQAFLGQAHVLEHHTFDNRLQTIMESIS